MTARTLATCPQSWVTAARHVTIHGPLGDQSGRLAGVYAVGDRWFAVLDVGGLVPVYVGPVGGDVVVEASGERAS